MELEWIWDPQCLLYYGGNCSSMSQTLSRQFDISRKSTTIVWIEAKAPKSYHSGTSFGFLSFKDPNYIVLCRCINDGLSWINSYVRNKFLLYSLANLSSRNKRNSLLVLVLKILVISLKLISLSFFFFFYLKVLVGLNY